MSQTLPPRWEENVGVYQTHLDDSTPLIVRVDLAARSHMPALALPVRLDVSLSFVAAEDSGLPPRTTFERLEEIEDRLCAELSELGGVWVGRLLGLGQSRWIFYIPAMPAANEAWIETLEEVFAELDVQIWTTPDDRWSFYREVLLPNAHERLWMQNQRLLYQLQSHGDDGASPRLIDHFALFDDEFSAQSASEQLTSIGFLTEVVTRGDDASEWSLSFSRVDALNQIHSVTRELLDTLNAFGGRYDGWGSPVIAVAASA